MLYQQTHADEATYEDTKGGFTLGLKPLEDVQGAKLLQDPRIAILLYQAPIEVKDNQISSRYHLGPFAIPSEGLQTLRTTLRPMCPQKGGWLMLPQSAQVLRVGHSSGSICQD